MQSLILEVCSGPQMSEFLTYSELRMIMQIQGPHFEYQDLRMLISVWWQLLKLVKIEFAGHSESSIYRTSHYEKLIFCITWANMSCGQQSEPPSRGVTGGRGPRDDAPLIWDWAAGKTLSQPLRGNSDSHSLLVQLLSQSALSQLSGSTACLILRGWAAMSSAWLLASSWKILLSLPSLFPFHGYMIN